ncbi:MAG: hypothetical protein H4O13_14760 [Xanthomonadales bacterium]|nr:hypothetical protein [Xanthomonadales bacterium]
MPKLYLGKDPVSAALRAFLEPADGSKPDAAQQRYWLLLGAVVEAAGYCCSVRSDRTAVLVPPLPATAGSRMEPGTHPLLMPSGADCDCARTENAQDVATCESIGPTERNAAVRTPARQPLPSADLVASILASLGQ